MVKIVEITVVLIFFFSLKYQISCLQVLFTIITLLEINVRTIHSENHVENKFNTVDTFLEIGHNDFQFQDGDEDQKCSQDKFN